MAYTVIDPSTWDEVTQAFISENPQIEALYKSGNLAFNPDEVLDWMSRYETDSGWAYMQDRPGGSNYYRGGGYDALMQQVKDSIQGMDRNGSRTKAAFEDALAAARKDYATRLKEEGWYPSDEESLAGSLYERYVELGFSPAAYNEFSSNYATYAAEKQEAEDAARQEAIDAYNAAIESGIPPWSLDPTPWDTTTEEDLAAQNEFLAEYLRGEGSYYDREQAQIAEETAAQEEAARQEAIDADLETLDELWSLRNESVTLAERDTTKYINQTTQAMRMRGVVPTFDDAYRSNLVQQRFSEYWSQENEDRLTTLGDVYGLPGEISMERINTAETTGFDELGIQNTTQQEVAAEVSQTTATDSLFAGLLGEEAELLEIANLLGS